MNYGRIFYCDIANGIGIRTSLFVSGCRHHCKECFNPETWDFSYGKSFDRGAEDEIISSLKSEYTDGISILGGEPMEPENQKDVLHLVKRIRSECPEKTIWVYSGFTYEELTASPTVVATNTAAAAANGNTGAVDAALAENVYATASFAGNSTATTVGSGNAGAATAGNSIAVDAATPGNAGNAESAVSSSTPRCVTEYTNEILSNIDILVDGEFNIKRKNISLRFRGSSNQRIIDVPASLKAGEVVLSDYM